MAIENLQPLTYAIISVAFVLGTSSIFLRLYCRGILLKTFGRDDAVAVFLLFVNGAQQAILYMFLRYGCGKHANLLSDFELLNIRKWLFVEEIFYMFTHWTIKQAFLFFYLRLSPDLIFQRCVYGTMALNSTFTVVNWLLAIFQAQPFDAIFHPEIYPDAKKINIYIVLMVPSVLNIITDLIILTLPIPTVLSLQMSTKRKTAVLSVVCFGGCAVLIALLRFLILYQLAVDPDVSYTLGKMIIVAVLEIELAVTAVNLPAMNSLFTKIMDASKDDSKYLGNGAEGDRAGVVEDSGGDLRLCGYKKGRESLSHQRKMSGGNRRLGGTLTESEEELVKGARGIGNVVELEIVNGSTMEPTPAASKHHD